MKKRILFVVVLSVMLIATAFGHDLFLKLDSYFVGVNEKISIKILNGSFQVSEGAVNFARLKDLSVVAPSGTRTNPKEADFTKDETRAFLNLQPTEAGTYVVGLSTMPRELDLKAKDFNGYLEEDGIPDTLAERKKMNELGRDVRERYAKHVKTIFQAGDKQSDNFKTILGYPFEIVPQNNPYTLRAGNKLTVQCLKDGKPLAGQVVLIGREDGSGKHIVGASVRTDINGFAEIAIDGSGKWYAKFINMTRLDDPKVNYESKWATLTFGIR